VNYRHLFHAGYFADVFKHVSLTLLLRSLQRKELPFCYFEIVGICFSELDLDNLKAAPSAAWEPAINSSIASPTKDQRFFNSLDNGATSISLISVSSLGFSFFL